MIKINSRHARINFSAVMDGALIVPVEITRTGSKKSVVMLSKREYDRLKAAAMKRRIDIAYLLRVSPFGAMLFLNGSGRWFNEANRPL